MRINYLVINNGIINILDQAILEFNMDMVLFRGNFINLVEVHIIKKLNSYLKTHFSFFDDETLFQICECRLRFDEKAETLSFIKLCSSFKKKEMVITIYKSSYVIKIDQR